MMRFYSVHDDAFTSGEWDPDVGKLNKHLGKILFYIFAVNPYDPYFEVLSRTTVPKFAKLQMHSIHKY